MIQFCSRQEAIRRMNQWGGKASPFLFLIDYGQEQCLVERLEEIDSQEIQFNLNGSTNQQEDRVQPFQRPFTWHVTPPSKRVGIGTPSNRWLMPFMPAILIW